MNLIFDCIPHALAVVYRFILEKLIPFWHRK